MRVSLQIFAWQKSHISRLLELITTLLAICFVDRLCWQLNSSPLGTGFIVTPDSANLNKLQVRILVTESLKNGDLQGLFGNFNGNPSDDMTPRGTACGAACATCLCSSILTSSSDSDIYNKFGLTCKSYQYIVSTLIDKAAFYGINL